MKILFTGNIPYDKFTKVSERKINGETITITRHGWLIEIISYDDNSFLCFNQFRIDLPRGKFVFELRHLMFVEVELTGDCLISHYNRKQPYILEYPIEEYFILIGKIFCLIKGGNFLLSFYPFNMHDVTCNYIPRNFYHPFLVEEINKEIETGMYRYITDEEYLRINNYSNYGSELIEIYSFFG